MASSYPGSLDSFDTIASDKKTSDAVGGRTHRQMHNDLGDAIEAVQAELGTDPAGAYATVKARFEAIEGSTLPQIDAKGDLVVGTADNTYDNLTVKNGDQIFFGEGAGRQLLSVSEVFVTGEVKKPGPVPFESGLSVQHYLAAVGGFTNRADASSVEIYKGSGERLRGTDLSSLEPGDTIYVPEKTFKFWNDHLTILTALLGVVTTTIAITR